MSIPTAADTDSSRQPAVLREGAVTLTLGVALVLVIMNTMMFNLALPSVTLEFGISPSLASWIVTGYSIVFAIASITYSRLSDFVPIRRLLAVALLCFGLAAVVGLFSQNFAMLLAVRIVQASGAGAVPALALVLVSRYVPISRRGRAMATVMSAASLGLGLGPVVGGAIVEFAGWRFLFAVTAVTLALVPLFVSLLPKEKPAPGSFDVWGALLVGAGTTGLLLCLTTQSVAAAAAGVVSLTLFAWRIRSAAEPFVNPSLFRNGRYLLLGAVGVGAYLCSFASLFVLPQLLANLHGLSAVQSGLVIFPGSLLAMLLARRAGTIIDRYGNGVIIRYAPYALALAAVLFALFASRSHMAVVLIYMLVSAGFSFLSGSVSNEMSRILPGELVASGMGLFQLMQFFSGAFGVAATASALVWQRDLPLSAAYANIYWGVAILMLATIISGAWYLRSRSVRIDKTVARE